MTVVGGLRSRAGVVVGSMFFALLDRYFAQIYEWFLNVIDFIPGVRGFLEDAIADPGLLVPAVGAGLLILTLIQFPGGIGQQLRPITRWFRGEKFDISDDPRRARTGRRRRRCPSLRREASRIDLRRHPRARRRQHQGGRMGDRRPDRPERRREDDALQLHHRLLQADERDDHVQGTRHLRSRAAQARRARASDARSSRSVSSGR